MISNDYFNEFRKNLLRKKDCFNSSKINEIYLELKHENFKIPQVVPVHRVHLNKLRPCLNVNMIFIDKNRIEAYKRKRIEVETNELLLNKLLDEEERVLSMFKTAYANYFTELNKMRNIKLAYLTRMISYYRNKVNKKFVSTLKSYKSPPAMIPRVLNLFFLLFNIVANEVVPVGNFIFFFALFIL